MTDKPNLTSELKNLIAVTLDDVLSSPSYNELRSTMKTVQKKYRFLFLLFMGMLLIGVFQWLNYSLAYSELIIGYSSRGSITMVVSSSEIYSYNQMGKEQWSKKHFGKERLGFIKNFELDNKENIYVLNSRISSENEEFSILDKFSSKGEWLGKIGATSKDGNYSFLILRDGKILISNSKENILYLYSSDGKLITQNLFKVNNENEHQGNILKSQLPDGRILLLDTNTLKLLILNEKLEITGTMGSHEEKSSSHIPSDMEVDTHRGKIYTVFHSRNKTDYGFIKSMDIKTGEKKQIFLRNEIGEYINPYSLWACDDEIFSVSVSNGNKLYEWNPASNNVVRATNKGVQKLESKIHNKKLNQKILSIISGIAALLGLVFLIIFLIVTEKMARDLISKKNHKTLYPELKHILYDPSPLEKEIQKTLKKQSEKPSTMFWILTLAMTLLLILTLISFVIIPKLFLLRKLSLALYVVIITITTIIKFLEIFKNRKDTSATNIEPYITTRNLSLSFFSNELSHIITKDEVVIDAIEVKPFGEAHTILIITDKCVYKLEKQKAGKSKINSRTNSINVLHYPLKISSIINTNISKTRFQTFPTLTFETSTGTKLVEFTRNKFITEKFIERLNAVQELNKKEL